MLEYLAGLALRTCALAPGIGPIPRDLLDKHFLRKHGPKAYYGQDNCK
jgi:ribulose-5-phosphate 4-epimerase/fuculose-1-phosphate aldolase